MQVALITGEGSRASNLEEGENEISESSKNYYCHGFVDSSYRVCSHVSWDYPADKYKKQHG